MSQVMRKISKNIAPTLPPGSPAPVTKRASQGNRLGNRLGQPSDDGEEEVGGVEGGMAWQLPRGFNIAKQHTFVEHRSMIQNCRFNYNGQLAASLELEGAVK